MRDLPSIKSIWQQGKLTFGYIQKSSAFIKKNKLWKGYFKHGWVATTTLIAAIFFSVSFFFELQKLFSEQPTEVGALQSTMNIFSGIGEMGNRVFFSGVSKYIVLVILEMLIFHFAVKTYEVLSGEKQHLKAKHFIDAQIRMIKVVIWSWTFERIAIVLISIGIDLLNIEFTKEFFLIVIQFFFLGVAFIDNYNEQFKVSIKESFHISLDHLGATMITGFVAYVLMLIPLAGPILASFICAVGSTSYLFYYSQYPKMEMV